MSLLHPPLLPSPSTSLHLASWQMMMSSRGQLGQGAGATGSNEMSKKAEREREKERENHDRLRAAAGGAAGGAAAEGTAVAGGDEKNVYAELLVCHSRVISSYRSRQSRITRIIQPPHSIPIPIHIPIPYACLCFFARAHTYDLGVCVVATPALRWFSIFIRPASDVYPLLRPPLLPPPSSAAYRDIM